MSALCNTPQRGVYNYTRVADTLHFAAISSLKYLFTIANLLNKRFWRSSTDSKLRLFKRFLCDNWL